jgi:lysophospholipase L1-like esterase
MLRPSRSLTRRQVLALGAATAATLARPRFAAAQVDAPERWLFLGDSITYAGDFIALMQLGLGARGARAELLNLGLPSETCSGLSEPIHDPPRPDVHERLARVLDQVRPQQVVVCYGMNDLIYHPPSPERLEAFRSGMRRLIQACRAAGASVRGWTPFRFDPLPVRAKLARPDAPSFSYITPYERYDEVTAAAAQALTKLDPGVTFVDVNAAVAEALAAIRRTEPEFTFARDGIHPDALGHLLIARELLAGLLPPGPGIAPFDAFIRSPLATAPAGAPIRIAALVPRTLAWSPTWPAAARQALGFAQSFNRLALLVPGLDRLVPADSVWSVDCVIPAAPVAALGQFTAAELTAGAVLNRDRDLPAALTLDDALVLARRRTALLRDAWLSKTGHRRTGIRPGLPLPEAEAAAAELAPQLAQAAAPVGVELVLTRRP